MSKKAIASRVLKSLFGEEYFYSNRERLLRDFAKVVGDPEIELGMTVDDIFAKARSMGFGT
jgi:hypothetical protein